MWELDGEWLTSNEVQALAAEVKRLTEENTSITNALEFLGVECIDGDIRIQMSKKAKWARAQLAFDTLQIERLESEVKRLTEENARLCGYNHAAADQRWIPIQSADDLPKENGYYLATCGSVGIDPDDTTSHELNWFGGKWYLPSDEMIEMDGVIAWMEKPKPYTEPADNIGEEEEK